MFDLLTVVRSPSWLTSILAMPKMRRHSNQPPLSHTQPSQGQIQPIDHFVCPQHHALEVVIVVPEEIRRRSFAIICLCPGTNVCFCDSRGEERRAVHQRAVVVVADQVVLLGGLVTRLGPVGGPDVHGIVGVVKVDDVNVKDEHG